jgi:hypothetical protein
VPRFPRDRSLDGQGLDETRQGHRRLRDAVRGLRFRLAQDGLGGAPPDQWRSRCQAVRDPPIPSECGRQYEHEKESTAERGIHRIPAQSAENLFAEPDRQEGSGRGHPQRDANRQTQRKDQTGENGASVRGHSGLFTAEVPGGPFRGKGGQHRRCDHPRRAEAVYPDRRRGQRRQSRGCGPHHLPDGVRVVEEGGAFPEESHVSGRHQASVPEARTS